MAKDKDKTDAQKKQSERLNLLAQLKKSKAENKPSDGIWYSRIVRTIKYILPLAALGLTAIIIVISDAQEQAERMLPGDELKFDEAKIQNELVDARFESFDNKNQPFMINASRATQSPDNPDLVKLEEPAASIQLENGANISITADNGLFHQTEQELKLDGGVKIEQNDGYIFQTEHMFINLKNNRAETEKPVYAEGPEGKIMASGVIADRENNKLIFKGPAKMVITTQNKKILSP